MCKTLSSWLMPWLQCIFHFLFILQLIGFPGFAASHCNWSLKRWIYRLDRQNSDNLQRKIKENSPYTEHCGSPLGQTGEICYSWQVYARTSAQVILLSGHHQDPAEYFVGYCQWSILRRKCSWGWRTQCQNPDRLDPWKWTCVGQTVVGKRVFQEMEQHIQRLKYTLQKRKVEHDWNVEGKGETGMICSWG